MALAPEFVKPALPGTSIRFTGEPAVTLQPSFADTVAIPLVHNWGPLGSDAGGAEVLTSFRQFETIFGTDDTAGRTAVLGAFNGMGLPGQAGAGGVIAYRMATGAAAKATRTLTNTSSATAALRLRGFYTGTRGNEIQVEVAADPTNVARDQLRLVFRGVEVEKYRYTKTDITALAAAINARPSKYVTADGPSGGAIVTGTALTPLALSALSGGLSGEAVTSTEFLAALDNLQFRLFGIIAPYDVTDAGIQASLLSWVRTQEEQMRPVMLVVGGAAGETVDDALTRATALEDPDVVTLGVGTYHDDLVGKDLSTSQLAPRLAGVLAARGQASSLTFAQMAGLSIVGDTGLSPDELVTARDGGVTVLKRTSNPDSELVISQGVTTFNNQAQEGRPYAVFSEPRMVRILHNYVRDMTSWGNDVVIGDLTVTDDTRALVYQHAKELQDALVADNLILASPPAPGIAPFVTVDPPDDPSLADAIPYKFGWTFARTANYILGEGRVR